MTTSSTGFDIDPHGYGLEVHPEGSASFTHVTLPPNGIVIVPALRRGNYLLSIFGAPNCDPVMPSPRTVAVEVGSATAVRVEFICAPPGQLAFASSADGSAEIYVINSNSTGASRISMFPALDVDPTWSPDGSRIAFASRRDGNLEIYVMMADGTGPVRLTTGSAADYRPAWSPDGARMAFVSERDGNAEIYVMNTDGTNPVRVTSNDSYDGEPAWSPDGSRIVFRSDRDATPKLYFMNPDGSGVGRVTIGNSAEVEPAWSPDGSRIAFSRITASGSRDIYTVNVDGSSLTRLTMELSNAADPSWSPDGRKIVFAADLCRVYYCDDPVSTLVVTRADATGYAMVVSDVPASNPAWRPR